VPETIRRNGRVVPGFALGDEEAARFRVLLDGVLRAVERFSKSLTPRELVILRLGLTASHLEESIAHGDWKRADAHADSAAQLVRQLEESEVARA
jgi:hypothetical protein